MRKLYNVAHTNRTDFRRAPPALEALFAAADEVEPMVVERHLMLHGCKVYIERIHSAFQPRHDNGRVCLFDFDHVIVGQRKLYKATAVMPAASEIPFKLKTIIIENNVSHFWLQS